MKFKMALPAGAIFLCISIGPLVVQAIKIFFRAIKCMIEVWQLTDMPRNGDFNGALQSNVGIEISCKCFRRFACRCEREQLGALTR